VSEFAGGLGTGDVYIILLTEFAPAFVVHPPNPSFIIGVISNGFLLCPIPNELTTTSFEPVVRPLAKKVLSLKIH
jgi:hypothetical protein